jgi:outer membrane lipoprotein-sorting protein
MQKVILNIFLFYIGSLILISAGVDKDKVYNDVIKKYGKINTIFVICSSGDNDFSNFEIKAKQGNKYRIKMNNMEIISNGKNIWSYSPKKKSVLISDFVEKDSDISLDNIFFNIIPNLQPISLKSVVSNKKSKQYRLDLYNTNKNEKIKEIYLYIDNKLVNIRGIEVISDDKKLNMKLDIKKLEINQSIPDSIFTFKVPEGIEEIDVR